MASRTLFKSTKRLAPPTNTVNLAGGTAYEMSDEAALAQYASTGALNGTFYATAEDQLQTALQLAAKVSPEYLARVAVYAREQGLMKDMPALLLAVLSTRDIELTKRVFSRVCNDAKMVKNFVQIIRSGQVGRKSLGTALKRSVQEWLASRTEEQLFNAVVGGDPSLADIIKMVHPKPKNRARGAFYKYLIGKELTDAQTKLLPESVRAYEKFKKKTTTAWGNPKDVPEVPFQLLSNLKLTTDQYRQVAENMSWSALRQNLNSLSKHDVFQDPAFTKAMAAKLADPEAVRKAKAFPFQLFSAYRATAGNSKVPVEIANALQDAMEASLTNVPETLGKTVVAVDISLSMRSPVTGQRESATTVVTCLDAAAVMGSALLRKNPNEVEILPFSNDVVLYEGGISYGWSDRVAGGVPRGSGSRVVFNGRDSVITNAQKLDKLPNNGTNTSSVLKYLNAQKTTGVEAVIYLSDNESWMDSGPYGHGSETMKAWNEFRKRNPKAKLVCVDMTPNRTSQAGDRPDILNVGGFSDNVFTVVDLFLRNQLTPEHWVGTIKSIKI